MLAVFPGSPSCEQVLIDLLECHLQWERGNRNKGEEDNSTYLLSECFVIVGCAAHDDKHEDKVQTCCVFIGT